jgi:hypothetical protein
MLHTHCPVMDFRLVNDVSDVLEALQQSIELLTTDDASPVPRQPRFSHDASLKITVL